MKVNSVSYSSAEKRTYDYHTIEVTVGATATLDKGERIPHVMIPPLWGQ